MGARVGIVGAGQLGRMMALAGYPLGIECRFVDTDARSPGGQVAPIQPAALDDFAALRALAAEVDVLTFDIENVAVDLLEQLADLVPVYPPPDIVAAAQDRLTEKQLFQSQSIPTAPFVAIGNRSDLAQAGDALGWPLVIKARRLGYDGRGQRIVTGPAELFGAWENLGRVPAIAEGWVDFTREISCIGVRGGDGAHAFYPLTENVHSDGILISSIAPYEHEGLQRTAERWLGDVMDRFGYRGVLTVEFFETAAGLVANEMAPRVHNSGHWTIEGSETSQFENHLRAILGWPLGDTSLRGHAGMVNLLGSLPEISRVLTLAGVHFHDYGKQPRPARKLGHCTVVDATRDRLLARLDALRKVVGDAN